MDTNINEMDILIGKYLSGEANAEESEIVLEWKSESTENQQYFDEFALIYHYASLPSTDESFDTNAAWKKVQEKIERQNQPEVLHNIRSIRQRWKPILGIAASLLLLLSVGYAIYPLLPWNKTAIYSQDYHLGGTQKAILLEDGTTISGNRNTDVTLLENKKTGQKTAQLSGEAFFDIKAPSGTYVVQAGEVWIEDIGTSFNVKAFPDSQHVEVFVKSGEVRMYTKAQQGIRLQAGESGLFNTIDKTFSRQSVSANVTSYVDKRFVFREQSLNTVIAELNNVYDTGIVLQNNSKINSKISVEFNQENIETIAQIIAETLELQVKKENGKIILYSSNQQ